MIYENNYVYFYIYNLNNLIDIDITIINGGCSKKQGHPTFRVID